MRKFSFGQKKLYFGLAGLEWCKVLKNQHYDLTKVQTLFTEVQNIVRFTLGAIITKVLVYSFSYNAEPSFSRS